MAQYNELPVYKTGYDLLLLIFQLTHNLNKEYKYSLGEKLKNEITELLANIYRANRVRQKEEIVQSARENLEIVRLYIRILRDMKQIGAGQHVNVNMLIENVSKQLAGWHKALISSNT